MFDELQWKKLECSYCHHVSVQQVRLGDGSFFAVVACPNCMRIEDAMILEDVRLPDV